MKLMTVLMGLFFVLSAQAQNQTRFGISRTGTLDLVCSLRNPAGKLEGGTQLYACTSPGGAYRIGLAGIEINAYAAAHSGSRLELKFHCTVPQPKGPFAYGGETIGFETSANPREKFFYAVGQGNYGRCYIRTDVALAKQMKMLVNQSGLVLIPAKAN